MLSVSRNQLSGNEITKREASSNCEGYKLNKDGMKFHPKLFKDLPQNDLMNPCGLFPLLY